MSPPVNSAGAPARPATFFSSFRAQMVAFIALVLLATALVISLLSQQQENRTRRQVDEYIRAITLATDLPIYSLSEGLYLYTLVNQPEASSLKIDAESIVQHILVVDADGKIFDSTDRDDIGQSFRDFARVRGWAQPVEKSSLSLNAPDAPTRTLFFSLTTDKAKRNIYIIISMNRLQRIKETGDRARAVVFAALGGLLILIIALFSKRFTRPITELGQAARKVTEGDLDVKVAVSGPQEVSALSATFNEMLVGLRRNRDLEEQLQRAERSAVVGRLASGIAHEIRNPLNFINLSIDHLRAAFAPPDETARGQYSHILVTIKDEIARLNRLVSDFLSYGRPAKLKLRNVDARQLVEEVGDLVAAQAEQQGVHITIEQTGDAHLQADAEQIKTCFSNLMINAVQAMPEGGALHVKLNAVAAGIELEFADTGVGIAPENLQQIFEPYYSSKETGIGLGLPLTKKIIEEHGGQLRVTSEPGRGTHFTVWLPRNPQPAAAR